MCLNNRYVKRLSDNFRKLSNFFCNINLFILYLR